MPRGGAAEASDRGNKDCCHDHDEPDHLNDSAEESDDQAVADIQIVLLSERPLVLARYIALEEHGKHQKECVDAQPGEFLT